MERQNVQTFGKKIALVATVLLIIPFLVIFPIDSKAAPKEEITLKLVSAWPPPFWGNTKLKEYVDRVNKQGAGKIKINFLGGSEIASMMENVKMTSQGTFDLVFNAPTFYAGLVPEGLCTMFVVASPAKLRQIGYLRLQDQIHRERAGLTVLGFLWRGEQFAIYSRVPIKSTNDFKGLKLRSVPVFDALFKALGASPVTLATPEQYAAIQRGVVDGIAIPKGMVARQTRLYEVAEYIIHPAMPYQTVGWLLANAKSWDALPEDVRKLMTDTILDMEADVYSFYQKLANDETEELVKLGMKILEMPPAEANKYRQLAIEVAWDSFVKRNAKYGPRLQEIVAPLLR